MADDVDRANQDQEMFDKIRIEKHTKAFNTPSGVVDCEDCDDPIGAARLVNVPSATRCVDCQELEEGRL